MPNFEYTSAKPDYIHNYNDRVPRVVGNLRVPTTRSKEILQQAKGITLIEPTQIRWFSRWSGGGGWSGRAEAPWRPRISKLRTKGLFDYHSSKTVAKAARRRASGPNKSGTLTTYILNRESWKAALCLTEKGQKAARQRKSTTNKRKIAYFKLQVL